MDDVTIGEEPTKEDAETSEESSTEETAAVDEVSAEEEEHKVPLSRLRQETTKRREAESKISKIEEKLDKLESSQNITGDKEQEAKAYLKGL